MFDPWPEPSEVWRQRYGMIDMWSVPRLPFGRPTIREDPFPEPDPFYRTFIQSDPHPEPDPIYRSSIQSDPEPEPDPIFRFNGLIPLFGKQKKVY